MDFFRPLDCKQFILDYFERKPLFLERNSLSEVPMLVTMDDFDRYMSRRLRASEVRLAKFGETISPFEYTYGAPPRAHRTESEDLEVDMSKILASYCRGYTIILHSMESINNRVLNAVSELEKLLGGKVNVNAYLTPKASQGFPKHDDDHDVLILQVSGEKEWVVYQFDSADSSKVDDKAVLFAGTLRAGDLLYIPREFPHEAKTSRSSSAHLTFGLHPTKIHEFAKFVIDSMVQSDNNFRRTSFIAGSEGSADRVQPFMKALAETFACKQTITNYEKAFARERLSKRHCSPLGTLLSIESMDRLDRKVILKAKPGVLSILEEDKDTIILRFDGSSLSFPRKLRGMIDFVHRNEGFQIESIPGNLSLDVKVTIIRKLVAEGYLIISSLDK